MSYRNACAPLRPRPRSLSWPERAVNSVLPCWRACTTALNTRLDPSEFPVRQQRIAGAHRRSIWPDDVPRTHRPHGQFPPPPSWHAVYCCNLACNLRPSSSCSWLTSAALEANGRLRGLLCPSMGHQQACSRRIIVASEIPASLSLVRQVASRPVLPASELASHETWRLPPPASRETSLNGQGAAISRMSQASPGPFSTPAALSLPQHTICHTVVLA
jgi:hypothetical protein